MQRLAGTGRLNRVSIATVRGPTEITWAARSRLLDRLRHVDGAASIRQAFLTVGATRSVKLGERETGLLVDAIDDWADRVGASRLPAGILDLRNALVDDLDDRAGGP